VRYAFTNFAGTPGETGGVGGLGRAARFSYPAGVAVDSAGNVYVSENTNWTIRKITPAGEVTTLAGSPGQWGSADGTGSEARFYHLGGLAVDIQGNVYVGTSAEGDGSMIRKITPAGMVTTLAGSDGPFGAEDGTGSAARFKSPWGVAVDNAGNIYVADFGNHTIRKITPAGVVTTLAGDPQFDENGRSTGDAADGTGTEARFYAPYGVAVDRAGNVYVADSGNNTIRKISPAGMVTTLAGRAGQTGNADGSGSAARFSNPGGLAVDSAGNVYVADSGNHTIRRITPAGAVTTLGGSAGQSGSPDGIGSVARFSHPGGVAVDSASNLYVADWGNNRISKGTPVRLSEPRFGRLSVSGGMLTAEVSGLVAGVTVVLESSTNLRDWSPIQTNLASGDSQPISLPISPAALAVFFRATVK
jgi:sugar lactone lactonase YvrE